MIKNRHKNPLRSSGMALLAATFTVSVAHATVRSPCQPKNKTGYQQKQNAPAMKGMNQGSCAGKCGGKPGPMGSMGVNPCGGKSQ